MARTIKFPESSKISQKHRYILLLLLLLLLSVTMIMNNCFKLGFDIHYLSISYPRCLQDHIDIVSHLDFRYFDLVKHGSQGHDSKNNMIYICSRHAQNRYYGFSFESLAPILLLSDYYHLIIGQMIKFYSRWQYDWFS